MHACMYQEMSSRLVVYKAMWDSAANQGTDSKSTPVLVQGHDNEGINTNS